MIIQKILYTLGRHFTLAYARLLIDYSIQWHAPLPAGPKLIVANHPSFSDPFAFMMLSPRPISILITATAFLVPLFGLYLRKTRHIPVDSNGRRALNAAISRLKSGESVGLFIEGHSSPPEGGFHPPRTGAVRMALQTGVPIVPVGIHLARERLHVIHGKIKGKIYRQYWYLRGPLHITVGEPIRVQGQIEDRAHVRAETQRVMQHIITLVEESRQRWLAKHTPHEKHQ